MTLLSARARHGTGPARAVDGVQLAIDARQILAPVGESALRTPSPRTQDRPMPPPHVPATRAARSRP
ncbi:hypothetical protein [Streptomyces sp. NPDC057740]|uniref:hypothetical protein n=1 Tax=Streptomyces sp. NPDC057740 TaxID=3346234 RepID=UPI003699F13D